MKKFLYLAAILAGTAFVVSAYARQSQPKPVLEGTVIRVDRYQGSDRMTGGDNPSDAPMADPEIFAYDVSIHVNCGTYVGRYQSWYDHIPSVFRADQKIQLRLTRSSMVVTVPNERDVELSIVSKHIERGPCEAGTREVASR